MTRPPRRGSTRPSAPPDRHSLSDRLRRTAARLGARGRRAVPDVGRRLRARLRERRRRRLLASAPRRRVADLGGVAYATVVGRVERVEGDGPAVVSRGGDGAETRAAVARTTRPFVVADGTGRLRVRVPPAGDVVHRGPDGRDPDTGERTVDGGDDVTVTGRVRRTRRGAWAMSGPRFLLVSPP